MQFRDSLIDPGAERAIVRRDARNQIPCRRSFRARYRRPLTVTAEMPTCVTPAFDIGKNNLQLGRIFIRSRFRLFHSARQLSAGIARAIFPIHNHGRD